jgi:hypothetical protein
VFSGLQSGVGWDKRQELEPQGSTGESGEFFRSVSGMAVVTPKLTADYLEWLGQHLDDIREVEAGKDPTERDYFSETFLKIRTKTQNRAFFRLNRAQQEYSYRCTRQNVVLKARQLGTRRTSRRDFSRRRSRSRGR